MGWRSRENVLANEPPPPGVRRYRIGVACWRNWERNQDRAHMGRHGRTIIEAKSQGELERACAAWRCPLCGAGAEPPPGQEL